MGRKAAIAIAVSAAAALVICAAAAARDGLPPKANVKLGERSQRLAPFSGEWFSRGGEPVHCVAVAIDGYPRFGRSIRSKRRRARPAIVFHKPERPTEVIAFAYRELDRRGFPKGDPKKLRVRLRLRERAGGDAWLARFRVNVRKPAYVVAGALWEDNEGCGPSHAFWDFTVLGRSS